MARHSISVMPRFGLLLALLLAAWLARAQSPSAVVAQLGSSDWETRWRAAELLKGNAELLHHPAVETALVRAYARSLQEAREHGLGESERWERFSSDMILAILRMEACCNPALAATALVENAAYNWDSPLARAMAADPRFYPALFAAASRPQRRDGKLDAARQNALGVLATAYAFSLGHAVTDGIPGSIFHNPNVRLTAAQRAQISRLVWAVAENRRHPDRPYIIDALGMLGTERVKQYLLMLAAQGHHEGAALTDWLVANGVSIPNPEHPCEWLRARAPGDAFAMVYRVATIPNGWDLAARSDLAAMYALAHGRPAPTLVGLMAASDAASGGGGPTPRGELVCRVAGFRLDRPQLEAIQKLIMAASKRPRLGPDSYQDVGRLGDEAAREFLAKAAAGSDRHAAYEARIGLGLWALTNGRPLPGPAER